MSSMKTVEAAAYILGDIKNIPEGKSTIAALYPSVALGTRSAAFRLLSKKGLIEVAFIAFEGTKNWKPSELARDIRDGEELSAVL